MNHGTKQYVIFNYQYFLFVILHSIGNLSFFLYMINIAYCNLKDFDYATDLLSDLSLGIETSVVDRLICYFILQLAGDPGSVASIAGSDHGLTMNMQSLAPSL